MEPPAGKKDYDDEDDVEQQLNNNDNNIDNSSDNSSSEDSDSSDESEDGDDDNSNDDDDSREPDNGGGAELGERFDNNPEQVQPEEVPRDEFEPAGAAAEELTEDQQRAKEIYMSDPKRRIRALAEQKYHLPGNNWTQDWKQYFGNNHPLFGIFFHSPDHPIGWRMRTMCFVSSVVFGLCVTNLFWLWARETDSNSTLFVVETAGRPGSNLTSYVVDVDEENNVEVTKDMALLWTLGGLIHGSFDNLIWTLSICACCDPGGRFHYLAKYKRFGVGLLAFFIMIIIGITSLSVVVRGVTEADEAEEAERAEELRSAGITDDKIDLSASTKENYEFLMSYFVELGLAMFVYFPLTGTIFFWGGLGCFRYPIFGGRPYEVLEEERELQEILNDPEKVQALIENPEKVQDEEGAEEIWGMRQKNEDGEYEEDEPPCCMWCRRRNNKESDTGENGGVNKSVDDVDKVAHVTSKNVAELKWKSYPTVTKKNRKEDVGRAASSSSYPEVDKKNKKEDVGRTYPKVDKKNKKEDVSRAAASPARSKQASSYPKIDKKNKKEDVGRASASSSRSKQSSSYPKVDKKNKKEDVGRASSSSKQSKKSKKSSRK